MTNEKKERKGKNIELTARIFTLLHPSFLPTM
jgi:hypothetical protein